MKFAHSFTEALQSEDFPPDWQAAAIQYRQLKKCIKRVQRELASLGLNVETLRALIREENEAGRTTKGTNGGPVLHYTFDGTIQSFQPKLILTVDRSKGIELDLGLSEETRRSLEQLAMKRGIPQPERKDEAQVVVTELDDDSASGDSGEHADSPDETAEPVPQVQTVEIPLYADVEFFHNLTSELASLDEIQTRAEKSIKGDIVTIGHDVTAVAVPSTFSSRSDLYPWREIFRLYLETGIFFSTLECENHQERDVEDAQNRLEMFKNEIERLGLPRQFKHRSSSVLLRRFMDVNDEVMRVLRFQAINKVAMRKILKKFDKRTALGAKTTFPTFVASNPFLASHLAKAICYTMSSRILNIIPQLEDYLCPVCQSISIKPVRLSCSHVFCVRCLVKLQRERRSACPMCRSNVVLKANTANLDVSMLNFLRTYFPKEAKQKQKENDEEVLAEQWQMVHGSKINTGGCKVM